MPRDPVEQAVVFPGAAQPPRGEHEECQEETDDDTDDRRQPDRDMIEGKAKEPEGKLRPIADNKGNEPNHKNNEEQQADITTDTTHGIHLTGCAGHAPAIDGRERNMPKQRKGPGYPYIPLLYLRIITIRSHLPVGMSHLGHSSCALLPNECLIRYNVRRELFLPS
jgi:hypothetical protein